MTAMDVQLVGRHGRLALHLAAKVLFSLLRRPSTPNRRRRRQTRLCSFALPRLYGQLGITSRIIRKLSRYLHMSAGWLHIPPAESDQVVSSEQPQSAPTAPSLSVYRCNVAAAQSTSR